MELFFTEWNAMECGGMLWNGVQLGEWTGMEFDVMPWTVLNGFEVNRASFVGMECKRTMWNVAK